MALAHAQRCAELMAIAGRRGLITATCLPQAITLCWYLQRHSLPARLRIGIRTSSVSLDAHAWVELQGIELGRNVSAYHPFNPKTSLDKAGGQHPVIPE